MDSHHSSLAAKILALGCNPYNNELESRRKVQAGIFLAKLLRMKEKGDGISIPEQTGYFYKWFDGPKSKDLSKTWSSMQDDLSIWGLEHIEPPHRQEYCLRVCRPLHIGPDKDLARTGLWARGLSTTAYLKAEDWSDDGAREEIRDALGPAIEELYEEMRITLHNLNLPA